MVNLIAFAVRLTRICLSLSPSARTMIAVATRRHVQRDVVIDGERCGHGLRGGQRVPRGDTERILYVTCPASRRANVIKSSITCTSSRSLSAMRESICDLRGLDRLGRPRAQEIDVARDRLQRRAQLVTHAREKLRLGLARARHALPRRLGHGSLVGVRHRRRDDVRAVRLELLARRPRPTRGRLGRSRRTCRACARRGGRTAMISRWRSPSACAASRSAPGSCHGVVHPVPAMLAMRPAERPVTACRMSRTTSLRVRHAMRATGKSMPCKLVVQHENSHIRLRELENESQSRPELGGFQRPCLVGRDRHGMPRVNFLTSSYR